MSTWICEHCKIESQVDEINDREGLCIRNPRGVLPHTWRRVPEPEQEEAHWGSKLPQPQLEAEARAFWSAATDLVLIPDLMAQFAHKKLQELWIPVNKPEDLPTEPRRYWFTVENAKGERKTTLCNLRQLWVDQKIVAYMEVMPPYEGTEPADNIAEVGEREGK